MSRQQRTNYKRQRTTLSTPRQYNDFVWTITSVEESSQTLEIKGDFTGVVYDGMPAFAIVGSSNTLDSAVFNPPGGPGDVATMVLSWNDPVDPSFVLELPFRSPKLRNSFGGGLSAGRETWVAPTPPPALIDPTFVEVVSNTLKVALTTSSPILGYENPGEILRNVTTGEWGSYLSWDLVHLLLDFSVSGLNSGDLIEQGSVSTRIFNSDGGHLNTYSFAIP